MYTLKYFSNAKGFFCFHVKVNNVKKTLKEKKIICVKYNQ